MPITDDMIEAGAQALVNDVWHPSQPLKSIGHEANKFRRQARIVLEAAERVRRVEERASDASRRLTSLL